MATQGKIQNPICESLKKFALLSSFRIDEQHMDEIRADFARNGRDCDKNPDKNRTIMEAKKAQIKQSLLRSVVVTKSLKKRSKESSIIEKHCVFCKNNGEPSSVVQSHTVSNSYGIVSCPRLRAFVCPGCGATGDNAHTIKYCPEKPIITMQDTIEAERFRLLKTHFKHGLK